MPSKPHSSPPTYRHHKARNQAFVQFQGRRIYLGTWGTEKSRERYQQFIATRWVKPEAVLPTIPPGDSITVVELAAAFWTWAADAYAKDGKLTGHCHLVKQPLHAVRQLYGTMPVAKFGPLCLEAVQQHLVGEGKARTYVNHLVQVIKQAFKWGVAKELVPVAVHQALATLPGLKQGRTAARETEPVGPVPDAVVDATILYLPIVVGDMVMIQRLTGCRPGEMLAMRPGDIDRTVNPWVYRPAHHKTEHRGKSRAICIGPKAQAILRPYLLRPADAHCFSPADSEDKRKTELRSRRQTPVQPSQRNRANPAPERRPRTFYVRSHYATAIRRAIDRANKERPEEEALPHWHPHQLRHSAATEIRRLFNLDAARVVLGHSKCSMTGQYAELDGRLAANVARQIG